jgi:hypothetical protein
LLRVCFCLSARCSPSFRSSPLASLPSAPSMPSPSCKPLAVATSGRCVRVSTGLLESHIGPPLQSVGPTHTFNVLDEGFYHIISVATNTSVYATDQNNHQVAVANKGQWPGRITVRCMILRHNIETGPSLIHAQ